MRRYVTALICIAAPATAALAQPVSFDRPGWSTFGSHSGIDRPITSAVRSPKDWQRLWVDLNARSGPPLPPPPIDFRRRMLLVAALGQRPTGGFGIRIVSVARRGPGLVATVVRTSPGRRCGTIQALTEPVDVVVVPRAEGPVRWRFRDEVTRC